MHGKMVALRNGLPGGVVDGAGVVEALFDVGREAGATKGHSHLFGYGDEEVFEYFEFDWIKTHRSPSISRFNVDATDHPELRDTAFCYLLLCFAFTRWQT